ncbi:MAG: outer membrane beta-barrel protein [Sinobacteraceae bacterium]|nr:outer membrane beta-barrel protein [Nevskiaceae bacterium]
MAPPAKASCTSLLAVCALLLIPTVRAQEDTRLRLPVQGAAGDETAVALTPRGRAADVTTLDLDAGVGESDNIFRRQLDKQSQTFALVGADFELRRAGARLDADVKGDFNYIDYLQNAFGNQLLGRFDGSAGWQILPERLRWTLEDNFGEAQIDPLAAVTPANLEHVNVVYTGPDLTLKPSQSTFVRLSARDGYTSYQTSPFNNNRIIGAVAVGAEPSLASTLSLNVNYQRIRFSDTAVNSDYDRRTLYGAYATRGSRTQLILNLGASQVDEGGSWRTTPLARLQLIRTLSAASLLELDAGRQYTDASDSFRGLQSGALNRIVLAPATGTTSNYLDQYATLAWRYARGRTSFNVSAGYERNTYPTTAVFDVDRVSGEVSLARRMTSALTLDVSGRAARESYFRQSFNDNDYLASAGLSYRAGRKLSVRLHFDHESRVVSSGGFGFVENRGMLTVGYLVLGPEVAAPPP